MARVPDDQFPIGRRQPEVVAVTRIDRTRLGTFFAVLLGLGVLFEVVSAAANVGMIRLAPIYMFTPMVAGAITAWRGDVSFSAVGLRRGRYRWLGLASVAPVALMYAILGVSLLLPGVTFARATDPVPGFDLPPGILGTIAALGLVVALGATVNAVLAFGEEFGWRGYLLWELAPLGFWRASLVIGAVWGLWHAPIIVEGYNYPSFPVVGVVAMTLATVAFSFTYTYLVVRARSVLAAVFFHGVFNAAGGLVTVYTDTESAFLSELVASPVGAASVALFLLVAVLVCYTDRPALTRSFAREERSEQRAQR
ncbi:CPBP family intramembrane metalloprotease domain-containing protein [Halobacteriales archaeon QS_1_67_19]|nr:MAG: CPBP family intramembrane metalloprotease domain-containing protein [Halobacteriales archaeon QS_1_67_19]